MPIGKLADSLVMERTALSRAIGPLQRDGLVAVGAGPDARTRSVMLTADGKARFKAAQAQWRRAQKDFETAFGASNAEALRADAAPPGRGNVTRPRPRTIVRATRTGPGAGPRIDQEEAMDERTREPLQIRAEDINPRYNWGRALPSLGIMGVDFEERVDYRRLHRYRLGRAKQALEKSELGALLVFDVNNIRYITSTKIGEWERDKLCRWALLTTGSADPILWDFGSAAVHHKLYTPWLKPENCKAGIIGLRGMVDPAFGLMAKHAKEIASLIKEAGVRQACRSASTSSSRR